MVKQIYIWYVEPLDSHTNKVISEQLSKDDFDKSKNLWECPLGLVTSLYASKEDLNLKFEIWGKQGYHGKIRKKTFLFKPKRKYLKKKKKKTVH
ncbi:hypothetical protein KJ841_02070 [Patescibacteria group bacterium]|nr:hypothetical protein [Patescibacteria group bacterium]